jgi:hypothetical protein
MIGQLGDGQLKWQRWVIALCWSNTKSMARGCLLRCSEFMMGPGSCGAAASLLEGREAGGTTSKRIAAGGGFGKQSMLEHVLTLYHAAEALHVYSTTSLRKKLFVLGSETSAGTTEFVQVGMTSSRLLS